MLIATALAPVLRSLSEISAAMSRLFDAPVSVRRPSECRQLAAAADSSTQTLDTGLCYAELSTQTVDDDSSPPALYEKVPNNTSSEKVSLLESELAEQRRLHSELSVSVMAERTAWQKQMRIWGFSIESDMKWCQHNFEAVFHAVNLALTDHPFEDKAENDRHAAGKVREARVICTNMGSSLETKKLAWRAAMTAAEHESMRARQTTDQSLIAATPVSVDGAAKRGGGVVVVGSTTKQSTKTSPPSAKRGVIDKLTDGPTGYTSGTPEATQLEEEFSFVSSLYRGPSVKS